MNRREYVTILGGSTVPAVVNDWKSPKQSRLNSESDGSRPSLASFLVTEEAFEDALEVMCVHSQRPEIVTDESGSTTWTASDGAGAWNEKKDAPHICVERGFSERREIAQGANQSDFVLSKAVQPERIPGRSSATVRDELHDMLLWKWTQGGTIDAVVPKCVETVVQGTESPHRRTDIWLHRTDSREIRRQQSGSDSRVSNRPCQETAASVATTEWGVLSLQYTVTDPQERGQTVPIVNRCVDRLVERAKRHRTPVVKRGELR